MESSNDRFERLAADFERQTGMLAPGKDQSAAQGGSPSESERARKWAQFLAMRKASA